MSDGIENQGHDEEVSLVAAMPGLVRLSAGLWWRATEWSITTSLRGGRRVLRAASDGESLAHLLGDATDELRGYLRSLLEIAAPEDERWRDSGDGDRTRDRAEHPAANGSHAMTEDELRERGAELLRRSADVYAEEGTHPAFSLVLETLAPDEGRILRLLAVEGPRAAVDIRSPPPLGIGSEMIASGMNMIGR